MISKVIISALLVCSSQAGNWKASNRQASNRPASNDLKLDTAEGTSLQVNVYKKPHHYGNTITVNGKRVIKADIKASNGVIHLIDGVMLIPKGDLVDTLVGDDRFSTLVAAVTAAGLVDTVKSADAFTIFAPTNDAFAKIPEATLNGLLADKEALTKVLP